MLSILLFIIYVDRCLKGVCVMEDKEITLAYVDYVAVVAGNRRDLPSGLKVG